MAKVGAAGATQYVAEGGPVPGDIPAEVRLVGPGAPEAEPVKPAPAPVRKASRSRAVAAGG